MKSFKSIYMKNENIIEVKNVSKSFFIPYEKKETLREYFIHFQNLKPKNRIFTPLKDISFSIKQGEFFGIIGKNGSGKSTLLKMIAGIYSPDKGSIHVYGKIASFLELGVGFHPELNAEENVMLYGMVLGLKKQEIKEKMNIILEYADLVSFRKQKVKHFSSGMMMRLAFSIAIQVDFDVLLLDEVLAVGDIEFQKKCHLFFENIKKDKSKAVIFVSHDLGSMEKYCDRVLLLEDGISYLGTASAMTKKYQTK